MIYLLFISYCFPYIYLFFWIIISRDSKHTRRIISIYIAVLDSIFGGPFYIMFVLDSRVICRINMSAGAHCCHTEYARTGRIRIILYFCSVCHRGGSNVNRSTYNPRKYTRSSIKYLRPFRHIENSQNAHIHIKQYDVLVFPVEPTDLSDVISHRPSCCYGTICWTIENFLWTISGIIKKK